MHHHSHSGGHSHGAGNTYGASVDVPVEAGAPASARRGAPASARRMGTGPVSRDAEGRRMRWVFVVTTAFMGVEAVAGWMSGSLALVADAGHMLSDASAIGLSLFAMRMAVRPPDARRTYGYVRTEILAALVNGAALLALSGWIVWEAIGRLREPSEVQGGLMLGVAVIGLIVNIVAARLLHAHAHDNLNVRGAYLHVLGDLLGSVGAIVAGALIVVWGWTLADPLISLAIALLILLSAWRVIRDATEVLMEAAPRGIDVAALFAELSRIEGLEDVHDLHVWTLTSGFVALSGHGVVDEPALQRDVLVRVQDCAQSVGIQHVTFQLEPRSLVQLTR